MKRWTLALLILLAAPAAGQVLDPTGAWGVWVPDRSTSATLGALNNAAMLQLSGRQGAGFQLTTANLSATVTPEVSFDNGTTWLATSFVTVGGTTSSTVVFSGGADTQQRSIVVVGGVSHVRVRVSAYTSGTSTAVVRNTAVPSILLQVGSVTVTQGTSPWVISGTVTANAGTNLNTSLLALESGGNLAGAATSLAIMDDWDESDRAKVNPIVGQAGVAANAGTASATTQRVIQASDSTLTVSAANNDGACVTVTGSSTALLASNASRRGMVLFALPTNTSTVFVKFGSTATVNDFPMTAGSSMTMMAGSLVYSGAVDGIRSSLAADQSLCVVEF